MKYWFVFYDKGTYKIRNSQVLDMREHEIAMFKNFQMAYQYVCRMNGDAMQLSRWVRR